MAITRVTQNMVMSRSMTSLQTSIGRLAKTQEQLSTGRLINRPSDSPTGTISAMRLRGSLADTAQYQRNAEDGAAWLGTIDNTLTTSLSSLSLARERGQQGINGANGQAARDALANEVEQIREGLVGTANTKYLGRPVLGGVTTGSAAYTESGAFTGTSGEVKRTVADGVRVAVNVNGPEVFGPEGDSVFDVLADLAGALRAGDDAGIAEGLDGLESAVERVTSVLADVGTRAARLESAIQTAKDATLAQTASLAEIEQVDLPRATVDLQMQEVAYQAALAATAKVVQPSLVDFLR